MGNLFYVKLDKEFNDYIEAEEQAKDLSEETGYAFKVVAVYEIKGVKDAR